MLRQEVLYLVFIGAVSVVIRIPCLSGDFVHDDLKAIVWNRDVFDFNSNWTSILYNDYWGNEMSDEFSHKSYRPLTTLSFRINALLLGDSATYFHLINSFLHSINCVLAYLVVKKLECSKSTAYLAYLSASIFSVHPVLTEATCHLVSRADLMWSLFALLALLCPQKQKLIVIFLTSLSAMSKEQGFMIVPMILSIQILKKRKLDKVSLLVYCPVLVLMVYFRLKIANFSSLILQEGDNPASFMESRLLRCLNFNYILALNFWLMVLPEWLCYDWALGSIELITSFQDPRILAIVTFWIMITIIALRFNWTSLVFMAIPFILCSNLLVYVGFVIAERNLYMPTLGYCILLSKGILAFYKRAPRITAIAFISLWVIYGARSIQRSLDWRNEIQLYKSAHSVCPNNAKIYFNLGKIEKDKKAKIQLYQRAIDLWPMVEAMYNLGTHYKNLGKYSEADALYRQALVIEPKYGLVWYNLGVMQRQLHQFTAAEKSYLKAWKVGYSDEESLLYNIAELYKSSWQFHKATNYVKTLNKLYPGNFRLRMLEDLLNDDMQFYGKKMLILCPKLRTVKSRVLTRPVLKHISIISYT